MSPDCGEHNMEAGATDTPSRRKGPASSSNYMYIFIRIPKTRTAGDGTDPGFGSFAEVDPVVQTPSDLAKLGAW